MSKDKLANLVSAALHKERSDAFKKPAKRLSKKTVRKIVAMSKRKAVVIEVSAPKCSTCDDTGMAAYPLRLCGDCDAGRPHP